MEQVIEFLKGNENFVWVMLSFIIFGIMYGLFDGAASLTKYLIEQEISKPTTASAFNY